MKFERWKWHSPYQSRRSLSLWKNSGRHSSDHQYELVWLQISWHITLENLIIVKIFWFANNYYGPLKARGWRKKFQKAYFLTKCDNLLLQRVTDFLLRSATKSFCKGRQVLQSVTIITKFDRTEFLILGGKLRRIIFRWMLLCILQKKKNLLPLTRSCFCPNRHVYREWIKAWAGEEHRHLWRREKT